MMPSPLCSPIAFAILFTLLGGGATAQPALPRDQAPAVQQVFRSFVDRLYSPDPKERAELPAKWAAARGSRERNPDSVVDAERRRQRPGGGVRMSPWLRRRLATSPDARKWMETSPAKEAAEALGDIGNASVPGLLQALAHSDWKTRMFAAHGLGEVDGIIERDKVIDALAAASVMRIPMCAIGAHGHWRRSKMSQQWSRY